MTEAAIRLVAEGRKPAPIRFSFTVDRLKREKPGTRQRWLYDEQVRGLALLVTPGGARTFYYAKRMGGAYRRVKIGSFPGISIEQARRIARKHDGQVADGKNPAEQRKADRSEWTFADLFDYYLTHHAKPTKRTWREDEQKYNDHLKSLRSRKLSAIRKSHVQSIITKLGSDKKTPRPGAANRLAALVSAVFNYGIDRLDLPIANPARGITRFPERSRERFLNADELKRFYIALEDEPPIFRDFFMLLLLTGARSGNVKAMRWEQVDLQAGVWIIPAEQTKAGKTIIVPLPPRAVEILTRRFTEAEGGKLSPWVFPSHRKDAKCEHLTEPKGSWLRICKAAQLKGVRIHDLRHTCATWQGKTGATLTTIGKALGHSRPMTTAIYTQTEIEQVRRSMTAAADAMLAANAEGGE